MISATVAEPMWNTSPADSSDGLEEAFSMEASLLISLALHALLIFPVVFFDRLLPTPVEEEKLVVELFGMISNRQTQQQMLGEKAEGPRPAQVRQKATPRVQVKALAQSTAESPVKVEQQQERREQQQDQAAVRGADEQHVQQTLRNNEEANLLRRYLAELKKAVKNRLVYPPEAKQAGQTGAPEVTFAIAADGQLQAGSLVVARSSGFPLLDEAALRAVRAAAPFPPPPYPMAPKLEIPFAEDGKK